MRRRLRGVLRARDVTHAVKGKGNVTSCSSTTTAGGKGVARTMDTVAINCTAPNMKIAQGSGPLLEGVSIATGQGGANADAAANAATNTAVPANKADRQTKGGASCNPAPCQGGHPVAIESGFVIDDSVDLSLPGVIPLTVLRSYSSQRHRESGLLGKGGWVLSLEQWVVPEKDLLAVRLEDGRDAYFAPIGPGESWFHRREQLELFAERGTLGTRYRLWDLRRRLWRIFEPQVKGGEARLVAIADAFGNRLAHEYEGDRWCAWSTPPAASCGSCTIERSAT